MKTLSQLLFTLTISTIIIGGVAFKANDIIASATDATNSVNIQQLKTALELYYSDHDSYPPVADGTQLIEILWKENYIQNKPLNPSVFIYQRSADGQNYILSLK
jgi:type II secretory pathway pseudopilin PulG